MNKDDGDRRWLAEDLDSGILGLGGETSFGTGAGGPGLKATGAVPIKLGPKSFIDGAWDLGTGFQCSAGCVARIRLWKEKERGVWL